MIPRSLGGRLVAAFAILALAIVLAVGGTLFLVLRGLHQDATLGALANVAGSVLPQVRDSIGSGELRGTIEEVRSQLAEQGILVLIVGADGQLRPIAGAPIGNAVIETAPAVGGTVKGTVTMDGVRYLYVATSIRRIGAATPRGIAFLELDRSGALALADVGRTLPIVILAILLIAAPLALVLARSVTRPLRRLADATADIPSGGAAALPLSGPREVRELTGTFNAMTAELDSTRQRERELLANLRHDLRTPLTVIAGFAAALRDGTAKGDAADAAARAIEEEAGRLERLVAEVGAVQRIGSGEEAIRPEMLDARLLIAETVARFRAHATAAGVDLAPADESTEPLALAADRLAVERMLGNLVENAITAAGHDRAGRAREGHVRIAAAVERAAEDRESIRIDVLDDGPGFPDGSAARAFERFWRGDPARAGAGSGLGLGDRPRAGGRPRRRGARGEPGAGRGPRRGHAAARTVAAQLAFGGSAVGVMNPPVSPPTMPAMDIVELRSDTFTRPTREMLKAMSDAELGDDVWGEDPTAISLQEHCAELVGKEAGLFVPSGTMGNETALKALTSPGDDVIVESRSHVVLYEHGAPGVISGVILRLIDSPSGRLPVEAVAGIFASANEHTSRPSLVWQENTHNASGGRVIPLEHVRAVARVAHDAGAKAFMDGARIFNASVASGIPVKAYAAEVDALSFCFSKGLGAPIGSMLLGSREMIDRARVIRQMLGGGMRQVGLLCAAARVAVDTMVDRLAEDHENAQRLAHGLADALPGSVDPAAVETNMVYIETGDRDPEAIVRAMWDDGVRVASLGPSRIRAVTNKEVDRPGIDRAIAAFARAVSGAPVGVAG